MAAGTRRYHHGDLRAALVAEAVRRLDAAPEAALTLRGLARALGVSAMAPYGHFEDKDGLMDAVAKAGFDALGDALDAAIAGMEAEAPEARLAALARRYVSFGLARPGLYRLIFGHRAAPASAATQAAGAATFARLERAVEAVGPPGGDARRVAETAWALVHGLTRLIQDGRLDPEADLAARAADAARAVAGLARGGG